MKESELPYFFSLERNKQKNVLEALLFTSEEPLSIRELHNIISKGDYIKSDNQEDTDSELLTNIGFGEQYLYDMISEINNDFIENERPYMITKNADKFSLVTNKEYGKIISKINKRVVRRRLSRANLETLAIIAYKQPISRALVESIRGVASKEIINSLIDKKFVKILGRSDAPGKPLLYGTTFDFLKAFGLNSIDELPPLRELTEIEFESSVEESEMIFKINPNESSNN